MYWKNTGLRLCFVISQIQITWEGKKDGHPAIPQNEILGIALDFFNDQLLMLEVVVTGYQ